jgi:ankyrin repeat protein
MIKRCRNRKQLDRDLETLPSDLDETYNRILETIKGDDIIYATRILRWLAFSRRPLTLAEVAEVAALDPDRRPAFDRDEVLEEHDDILAICSSLVTIVAAEQTGTSQSSTALSAGPAKLTVILAHYSVKEYLVSKRILESGMSKYGMEAASCHRIIARCCVQYLLQFDEEGILTEENLHHFALAQYSAQRWITHSELGKGYDVELVKVVVELLMEKEQAYLAYFRLRNLSEYGRRIYFGCSRESLPEPLYFASMTGMSNIVQSLIDAGADVNAKGGICGTALQAASFKGWLGVVKSLIENGADVNAQGGQYGTALQATLSQGRLDIGRFLVEKGADVNARGGEHGNALQAALHDDDLGIVRFLVENGADVNMQGGKYCNALQTALHEGGLDVVEFLVKNGADLKTQGGKSLELAAKRGRLDMMKVLVEHGADLNTQSLGALRVASKKGRLDMIRFLVENGADLNSQAGKAIWAASYHDDLYILAVLIVHGADLKAQGSRALREALRGGHVDAIRSLVGADVDLKTHGSKTLMLAAGRGHLDVVKFLIDNGVDVNAPSGSWYENALEAASNGGHLDVIKILVESGADINAPIGGHWGGALAAASAWDYLEVVEFLVEHGADLETHGSRVLDLASRRGSMKVERFLVAKGVQRGMETQFWWQDSSC